MKLVSGTESHSREMDQNIYDDQFGLPSLMFLAFNFQLLLYASWSRCFRWLVVIVLVFVFRWLVVFVFLVMIAIESSSKCESPSKRNVSPSLKCWEKSSFINSIILKCIVSDLRSHFYFSSIFTFYSKDSIQDLILLNKTCMQIPVSLKKMTSVAATLARRLLVAVVFVAMPMFCCVQGFPVFIYITFLRRS